MLPSIPRGLPAAPAAELPPTSKRDENQVLNSRGQNPSLTALPILISCMYEAVSIAHNSECPTLSVRLEGGKCTVKSYNLW